MSLIKHVSATIMLLFESYYSLVHVGYTKEDFSYTMTKADRYLVKIKVSEDKSIFKQTFEQKMEGGYLLSAARQERTKDAL